MHSFMNDYSEGAHPRILELLVKSNFQQNKGYGEDVHSERAREYIRRALKREDVDIHFIPGGTMTNLLVISALLRPHQCVISPDTGHINVHETGAIEATGHKVIATPSVEGKLTPGSIQAALDYHKGEHMVQPKIIYISNSTELGTIYSKAELTAIHDICRQNDLILFLDGARIGSALMAKTNDLSLEDVAGLVDVFYIGGTKNGALLGEALQYLTSLVVNKEGQEYKRVVLDTENYRKKREETLRRLAKRLGYKVSKTRRKVTLEPMNPFERRIIHSALQNDNYVRTYSEGDEPYRRVVITCK